MSQPTETLVKSAGRGAPDARLSNDDLLRIVGDALAEVRAGARVLAIIPDKTRDDNTDVLFPFAAEALSERGAQRFDALVAQGTHTPMTTIEKRRKIGVDRAELPKVFGDVFDHHWDRQSELVRVGELGAARVRELTGGLLDAEVPLKVNRLLAAGVYDTVLVFGATVPHEVAGFAGGAKYFFPGVSGAELTHATHWLGALAGVADTIGRVETPVRRMIEAAAEFIPAEIISLNSVVTREADGNLRTHALFTGDIRASFRRAAEVSRRVHIKYTNREYKRVVALLDEHYDDMWTGGKASYRLGGVIEEAGELIIYAPHLRCISDTHGTVIERYGYATLANVRRLIAEHGELQENLCVAAHLTHVAYAGRRDAPEEMRFAITLASQVDAATCRRVRLNYMNPRDFKLADYSGDPDTLVVEQAGRDLYLVAEHDAAANDTTRGERINR